MTDVSRSGLGPRERDLRLPGRFGSHESRLCPELRCWSVLLPGGFTCVKQNVRLQHTLSSILNAFNFMVIRKLDISDILGCCKFKFVI